MAKKVEISKEGYLDLINQVYLNKLEERELALDRYRKADEQMETNEQFILMSKGVVSFLSIASTASSDIAGLAKEIKNIVYKDANTSDVQLNLTEDFKNKISEHIEELEHNKNRNKKTLDDNDDIAPQLNSSDSNDSSSSPQQ